MYNGLTVDRSSEPHPRVKECLDRFGIAHKVFECDPSLADTAVFCDHYGFEPTVTANCIIAASKTDPVKYACCVILATCKLDVNKKVCQLLGVKKASFASAEQTLALTEMQIGGVTPFGMPNIPIYLDAAIMRNDEIVLGGGNRSTKIVLDPRELAKLPNAEVIDGLGLLR